MQRKHYKSHEGIWLVPVYLTEPLMMCWGMGRLLMGALNATCIILFWKLLF